MNKKWYCYICGKKIKDIYHICTCGDRTDRGFLVCENQDCVIQIDDSLMIIRKVKEVK